MAAVPAVAVAAVSAGVLGIVGLSAALLVVYRGWLRRALLTLEDPRSLAAVRVVFAAGLLLGVLELVVDARWFFSDEGLLLAEGARAYLAGSALAGYEDGEFIKGLAGLWHYVAAGTPSTLHFWDSPAVVIGHAAALVIAAVGLMIGWRTRVCAWMCAGLLLMLLRRDNAMWGGEQVYLAVLFLLAVSRCGHAYSIDNWSRCRRLRARGLLSEPGMIGDGAGVGPGGEHPQGLAAIYRGVPAWPRVLIVLQLGVLYCANGLAKWGGPWEAGTATSYALQSDPYVRFDTLPVLAWFGETALRWGTWAVRGWESLFPVMIVGLVLAWQRRSGMRAPRAAEGLWAALLATVMATLALAAGLSAETGAMRAAVLGIFGQTGDAVQWRPLIAWGLIGVVAWVVQGDSPGRAFARRWVLGRGWLVVGLAVHGTLQIVLNLGGFPLATVGLYLACLSGGEIAAVLARLRGGGVVPMEDLALPQMHRDSAELPAWVMVAVASGLMAAVVGVELGGTPALIRWAVIGCAGLLVWAGWRTARTAGEGAAVWAYGPVGRSLAGALCVGHAAAIVVSQIPERPLLAGARAAGAGLVNRWLRVSGTAQLWSMFAPQPPQANGSLRVEVIDANGVTHDLARELHRPEELDGFQWWPDRRRKVLLNVMAERKGLVDWYARSVCREWALGRAGETPRAAVLTMWTAPIPLPWEALPDGGRIERFVTRARATPLRSVDCAREPHGQLPAAVRVRHGFAAGPFVGLPAQADRWPAVRAGYGPLWPYDEWLALGVLVVLVGRWRREERVRHRAAVAGRR